MPHSSLNTCKDREQPQDEPCQVLTAHPLLLVCICGACELQAPGPQPWSLITVKTCCPHLILSLPGSFFSLHTVSLSCAHPSATPGARFSRHRSCSGHLPLPSASCAGLRWHGNCTAAAPDWQECLIQGRIPEECKLILIFPVQWWIRIP